MFNKTSPIGCGKSLFALLALVLCSAMLLVPGRALAVNIPVTSNNDAGAGSLRVAIQNALAGDTIIFAANVTGIINLTSGEIAIGKDLTINGPGARRLTISGNNISRIFNVTAGTVSLSGVTIANGTAPGYGGGINNAGVLTVDSCTVTNNHSSINGGGFINTGTLTIKNSTISNNPAASQGGGINNSTGGILTLQASTLFGNTAISGGGIYDTGTKSTITNCTLSGNNAAGGQGGGIYAFGNCHIGSSIIAGNTVTSGGNYPDVDVAVNSDGYNLIGFNFGSTGFTATGDQVGVAGGLLDPKLGPLQNNGGPTNTLALLPGSPAIDKGKSALPADQRGRPHVDDPAIPNAPGGDGSDIGAYEVSPATLVVTNLNDSGGGSLRQAILDSGPGDTVTFAPGLNGTIILTSGELAFAQSIHITGPGANIIVVSGNGASPVFDITGGIVNISGLAISNGYTLYVGGGIFNAGDLTLSSCTVSNNHAGNIGGGLANNGTLTVTNSTISGNMAANDAGGIANRQGAILTLRNSTVAVNTANTGGGIEDTGNSLTITACTITGNTATGDAGGLYASSNPHIGSSIIAGNIIPLAATAPDVSGAVTSDGYNLIGNITGSTGFTAVGDQTGSAASPLNPRLGPLQNNGGPTQTLELLPGSPAIDAGINSAGLSTDQRGVARTFDMAGIPNAPGSDGTDIGAYELRPSDRIDFNGDSFTDLVLQNSGVQQVAFWFTNGANIIGGAYALSGPGPITLPPNWQVVGAGDFNGDGTPDLVLDNTMTGQIAFWFTSGNSITSGAYATANGSAIAVPSGWQIVGAGDFNGDGNPDLVLDNPTSGAIAVWTLNGTSVTSGAYVSAGGGPITLPSGWQIVGVGDLNSDGHPDLVLDNPGSGLIAVWTMTGSTVVSGVYVTNGGSPISLPAGWLIAAIGDYNGDGKPDLVLENLNSRTLAFWYLNGTALSGSSYALAGGAPFGMPAGWQVNGPR